jgi:hypothetical protein
LEREEWQNEKKAKGGKLGLDTEPPLKRIAWSPPDKVQKEGIPIPSRILVLNTLNHVPPCRLVFPGKPEAALRTTAAGNSPIDASERDNQRFYAALTTGTSY